MALGCFVNIGRAPDPAMARLRLVEELGYESCWVTHIAGWESLTTLTWYAAHSDRIRLGTGVVPIYSRTPATMAQTAASIDALSGGRLNLGLGVSHKPVVEAWHGQSIDKPVSEMREYVAIVRAILAGEAPPPGDKWQTQFRLYGGVEPRPGVPLYLAGLSPRMLRLAGAVAEGVVLWLCSHAYVRDVVVPEVRRGREEAGKDPDAFDIVAAVPCALTDDPDAARATLRGDLLPYFGLPFYRAMIERSGFGADIERYDAAAGDVDAMKAAISDEFLGSLAGIGDEAAIRGVLRAYAGAGCTSPCVGPVPRTDIDATLRSAATALA